uniref:Uncharacterized protein n=1 Tax=Arundo donax TaxID=35708 RepID=A0A0A9CU05_ARUDO
MRRPPPEMEVTAWTRIRERSVTFLRSLAETKVSPSTPYAMAGRCCRCGCRRKRWFFSSGYRNWLQKLHLSSFFSSRMLGGLPLIAFVR